MTKEEIKAKIEAVFTELKAAKSEVLQNELVEKANFTKEQKDEIKKEYSEKWKDILPKFGFESYKNAKGEYAVRMLQNNTEEKNMATDKTHDRIEKLISLIGAGLYEKETAVKLGLLTALAGESMFMIGSPGCAKSMIVRRIKEAFAADGKKYFETLLNQFTTPEEVYGNISLKALNGELEDENGNKNGKEEYRRLTEGFLPEADIAFLDEIWKANPAILNTLLTIVNEKKFHNGNKIQDVPLKALFAASNEFPEKDKGLDALYDRFIIRLPVSFIQDVDSFFEMIDSPAKNDFSILEEDKKLLITNEELKNWADEIDKVTLSNVAKEVILAIRKEMQSQNHKIEDKRAGEMFEVGDRRWKKIAHILKTSAFINDRDAVDLMDCSLIEHCIWGTEKQQELARTIVEKCLKENGVDCDSAIEDIEDEIEEFNTKINDEWMDDVEGETPLEIKMNDGVYAYKIVNPKQVYFADQKHTPYYVTKNFKWPNYNDRFGMLYDQNKNKLGPNYNFSFSNFDVDDGTVSWTDWWRYNNGLSSRDYEFEIGMVNEDSLKEFSDIAHETLQKNFDKDNYLPIVDEINSEIQNLKTQKENDAVPFKANLFADQSYNKSITSKIDEAIHQLEDAKIDLDKKRSRYYKSELNAKLSLGDVILKNGSVFTVAEIGNMTEEQKENVIAVVCFAGEKTYAIGVSQFKDKWDTLQDCCTEYAKKLPSEYADNWFVPNKEILAAIWQNRDTINKSLKGIGKEILEKVEYWSSSENDEEKSSYFQKFDDSGVGVQDHTTKGHEYKICVIREWQKI